MRLPIPNPPELTLVGCLWAFALGGGFYFLILALGLLFGGARWAAIIPALLILVVAAYLILGDLWNQRGER